MIHNTPLDFAIPPEDIDLISYSFEMYNYIMGCKNLGLQVSADVLTPEDLELLVHIQTEIDKAQSAKQKHHAKKKR